MYLFPVRSPVSYIGGKYKQARNIGEFIPAGTKKLCSPFMGGCSLELTTANAGIETWAYDTYEPLVNFFQCLQKNPDLLVALIIEYFIPLPRDTYTMLKKRISSITNNFERAAAYYAINKASFGGAGATGGMAPNHPNLNENNTSRLRDIKLDNIHFHKQDFVTTIEQHYNTLLYLDPPWMGVNVAYGSDAQDTCVSFDHVELFDLLKNRSQWIMSYGSHPNVRVLYKDFKMIDLQHTYSMRSNTKSQESREMLIISHDLEEEFVD